MFKQTFQTLQTLTIYFWRGDKIGAYVWMYLIVRSISQLKFDEFQTKNSIHLTMSLKFNSKFKCEQCDEGWKEEYALNHWVKI